MLSALAIPTYRRLFASQAISLAGTGLATVALGLLAFDLAGRDAGLVLGTVFAIKMVAYVAVAPVAAALVHAVPSKAVLVGADLVRVVVVLGLPFVASVGQVYALVLVLQAASAVHTPAYQAVLPRALPDERRYTEALSLARLAEDLEMLLSPLLAAALLLLVPRSGLFVGTAAGFAISALLVARLALGRAPAAAPAPAGPQSQPFARRVRRGAELMVRTPALRPVLALNLAVAAGGAYGLVQYVVIARTVFGRGDGAAALLLSALGAGSITVAVLLPRALERLSERTLMLTGTALVALATATAGLVLRVHGTPGFVLVGVVLALLGAGWAAAETPVGRIIVRTVPAADQPAVFAAQFSLSHACWLVAYPLAGWLGARGLSTAALVLAAVSTVAALATSAMWPRPAHRPAADLVAR